MDVSIRLTCQTCKVVIQLPTQPMACPAPPFSVNVGIKRLPQGWVRTEDGYTFCPEHPPQRVIPVAALPVNIRN